MAGKAPAGNTPPAPGSVPPPSSSSILHVTMDIEDEVVVAEPSASAKIAFFLSFLPILGYVGAIMAILTLRYNHTKALKTHGLTYATLALQIFYSLLMLTALVIGTQVKLTSVVPRQPSEKAAQSFLTAVQNNDLNTAKSYMVDSQGSALDVALPMYRASFSGTPLLIDSRSIAKPVFSDTSFQIYNGRPLSYQLWRVGSKDVNSRYLILMLIDSASGGWRIIQVQSLEAPGDSSAKSAVEQVVASLVSQ